MPSKDKPGDEGTPPDEQRQPDEPDNAELRGTAGLKARLKDEEIKRLVNEAFGRRLRELMEERKLTQSQLARVTGIDRTQINKLVAGTRRGNNEQVALLSHALDVQPSWLMPRYGFNPDGKPFIFFSYVGTVSDEGEFGVAEPTGREDSDRARSVPSWLQRALDDAPEDMPSGLAPFIGAWWEKLSGAELQELLNTRFPISPPRARSHSWWWHYVDFVLRSKGPAQIWEVSGGGKDPMDATSEPDPEPDY